MDGENSLPVLFVVRGVNASARPLSLRLQGHAFGAPPRDGLRHAPAQAPDPPAGLIRRSVPPKAAEVAGTLSLPGRSRSPLLRAEARVATAARASLPRTGRRRYMPQPRWL
jgi:hypothetical protein